VAGIDIVVITIRHWDFLSDDIYGYVYAVCAGMCVRLREVDSITICFTDLVASKPDITSLTLAVE